MNALFTFIERFKLNTKLLIGFSAGILVALVIGLNALSSLSQLEAEMERMYETDLQGIAHIKDANLNLVYMGRAMRQMLIAQDDASRYSAIASLRRAREKLLLEMEQTRKHIHRAEVIARYDTLQRDLTKALEVMEQATGLIQQERANPSAAARFVTSNEYTAIVAAADDGIDELADLKEAAAGESLAQARAEAASTRRTAMALLATGVVLVGGLGVLIGLSIQRPAERIRQSIETLAKGEVNAAIPHTDYPNEIGIMARAVEVLQGIYRQANELHWVKSHAADIGAKLQQASDFRTLAQTAVSSMAPVVGAGHGAFYVADGQGQFNLLASYGYRERKQLSNSYRLGDGLVGQCAMEKAAILLTAPQDYIRIGSGLGEAPPACVLVQPIIHGERVLGVLEMASFQPFTEREKALHQALLPALGTSMEILDRNLRTQELLTSTQLQAERMEKQAAQLEEQTVEMEAQQAELLETETWFRSIIETAPDGMLVVDAQGRIVLANPSAHRLLGYAPGDLMTAQAGPLLPQLDFSQDHGFTNQAVPAHTREGGQRLLDVSCHPLPDRGGRGKCTSVAMRAHVPMQEQA